MSEYEIVLHDEPFGGKNCIYLSSSKNWHTDWHIANIQLISVKLKQGGGEG